MDGLSKYKNGINVNNKNIFSKHLVKRSEVWDRFGNRKREKNFIIVYFWE
jgi:hypothetical protein